MKKGLVILVLVIAVSGFFTGIAMADKALDEAVADYTRKMTQETIGYLKGKGYDVTKNDLSISYRIEEDRVIIRIASRGESFFNPMPISGRIWGGLVAEGYVLKFTHGARHSFVQIKSREEAGRTRETNKMWVAKVFRLSAIIVVLLAFAGVLQAIRLQKHGFKFIDEVDAFISSGFSIMFMFGVWACANMPEFFVPPDSSYGGIAGINIPIMSATIWYSVRCAWRFEDKRTTILVSLIMLVQPILLWYSFDGLYIRVMTYITLGQALLPITVLGFKALPKAWETPLLVKV